MTAREELADRLYRQQYPDPESPRIQPLGERAQWEQDMIYRQVDIAAALWEEGRIAGNNSVRQTNPYTVPKPVPKTIDERFDFERAWDAKVEAGLK